MSNQISSKIVPAAFTAVGVLVSVVGLAVANIALAKSSATSVQHVHPLFKNPPIVVSHNGRLDVDLVAAPVTYTIDGHRFNGMLYNGAYIPPVWRVRAGDRINVTLHNRLAEETNLHFHGLDVSPLGNGDNVYLHIHPGQTFNYRVTVPQQHVGLFWFHPHLHGEVDKQLPKRIFLFKHHPIGRADYQELVTVNGMAEPDIPIRPGASQFSELAHIGADRFLKVGIQGMPFYVGRDGYFVHHPVKMNAVLLGPGQRVEAIVVGNRPGRFAFESVPFKFDVTMPILPRVNLGTVVSTGLPENVATRRHRGMDRPQQRHAVRAPVQPAAELAEA